MTVTTGGRATRSSSSPSSEPKVEVEGLEQLAVLVLGADHLDGVVQLRAEQLQRVLVDRLGRGDHLAEVEQHGDQRGRVGVDLLGEVGQRRAARQAKNLAVAAGNLHATDRRRLHVVELLTALLLALAPAGRAAAWPAERTSRAGAATAAAGTGTATTGTAAEAAAARAAATGPPPPPGRRRTAAVTAAAATGTPARRARATRAARAAARTAGKPPPGHRDAHRRDGRTRRRWAGPRRHHARVGARSAGPRRHAAGCRPGRTRRRTDAARVLPRRRRTGCWPHAGPDAARDRGPWRGRTRCGRTRGRRSDAAGPGSRQREAASAARPAPDGRRSRRRRRRLWGARAPPRRARQVPPRAPGPPSSPAPSWRAPSSARRPGTIRAAGARPVPRPSTTRS